MQAPGTTLNDSDLERVSAGIRLALFVSAGAAGMGLDLLLFEMLKGWAG